MEYMFILIVLVFLKILFWSFYCYFRAQRIRRFRAQERFVVVDSRTQRNIVVVTSQDRAGILQNEQLPAGYLNAAGPMAAAQPPSYDEVVPQNHSEKPPPYSEVVKNLESA